MSNEKVEITRKFRQCGDHVLMEQKATPLKLTAKHILTNIDRNASEIDKCKNQLNSMTMQKNQLKENIAHLEESTKEFEKHEEWAIKIQQSKLKAVVNEVKDEIEKKVMDTYEYDDALTKEQNNIQMFHQYREFICRHPKIAEEIASRLIATDLRKKGYLETPFS